MQVEYVARAFALALMVAGTSILAAPAQVMPGQTTAQAGQMTEARVYIQNRGRGQAVPVELRDVNLESPLRVQVINGDPSMRVNPVMVAETRKVWEYETIAIPAGAPANVAVLLNAQGANGWETTGISLPSADGMTVLLKRPR
jgi:hypothetical protein